MRAPQASTIALRARPKRAMRRKQLARALAGKTCWKRGEAVRCALQLDADAHDCPSDDDVSAARAANEGGLCPCCACANTGPAAGEASAPISTASARGRELQIDVLKRCIARLGGAESCSPLNSRVAIAAFEQTRRPHDTPRAALPCTCRSCIEACIEAVSRCAQPPWPRPRRSPTHRRAQQRPSRASGATSTSMAGDPSSTR